VGGYVPGNPDTDNGADELTVLSNWKTKGLIADGSHKIAGWMKVDGSNPVECRQALWLFENCLAGDTKIPLLDGTCKTIKQLADDGFDKKVWVYSCDKSGNIVPGLAHSARRTAVEVATVRVLLDSGEEIRCTSEHQFLLRDGSYREAAQLRYGDSLMPLYRRLHAGASMSGYEQILNPATMQWRFTHRAVASNGGRYSGEVVHHKNFEKTDNRPDNLQVMTWADHIALHSKLSEKIVAWVRSDVGRETSSLHLKSLWADPDWRRTALRQCGINGHNGVVRRKREGMPMPWELRDIDKLKESCRHLGASGKGKRKTEAHRAAISIALRTRLSENLDLLERRRSQALLASMMAKKKVQQSGWSEKQALYYRRGHAASNHKVVSVDLSGATDVYDLTVDQHHNFALASGVFVHNCYFGIELPDAWVSPFPGASGFVWDVAGDSNPDQGHCFMSFGFNENGYRIDTWGMFGLLTNAACAKYATTAGSGELYCVFSQDILNRAMQKSPGGFSWAQLVSAANAMGGNLTVLPSA
jgi:hypothetical protein